MHSKSLVGVLLSARLEALRASDRVHSEQEALSWIGARSSGRVSEHETARNAREV